MRRLLIALVLLAGFAAGQAGAQALQPPPAAGLKTAAFAGGCFWCMEHPFDSLPGVTSVISGYTGGKVQNPHYEQVSEGSTGHRESVQVTYDPTKVEYAKLLEVFWRNIDPLDARGQFCDKGMQYTTAIYAADDEQRAAADASLTDMQHRFAGKVATVVEPTGPFWRAEDYHQGYYKTNPLHYKFYRWSCGRDARLDSVWGKEARAGVMAEAH